MLDHHLRNFQLLQKADLLIAKIWLAHLGRRFGLFAFSGLIAAFGLGMANLAGFYALQAPVGAVWAAAIVAFIDFGIAAIVLLAASNSHPGQEIDLAFEARQMAIESVQEEARELKLTLDALGQEVKSVKANITQVMEHPIDAAAQKLLIPAVLSILRTVRSKREQA